MPRVMAAALFLIVFGTSGGGSYCGSGLSEATPEALLSSTSPSGLYRVELRKHLRGGGREDSRPLVSFSAWSDERLVVADEPLYAEDFTEAPFASRYPDHAWVGEAAIRLGQKADFGRQQDELYVSNNTGQTITFLRISTFSEYLIFDLRPKSVVKVPVYWPPIRGKASNSLTALGRFEGGKELPQSSADFDVNGRGGGPAHFCLTINEAGVDFASREFEGRKSDHASGAGASTPIPKVTGCPN